MNLSEKEVRAEAGQYLAPGGMIHCATYDGGGWSGESNKEMQMAILWREEQKHIGGADNIWATNVEGLSQNKMKELEAWVKKEEPEAFAIALSEVKRATGRRRVGSMMAHWSLDKEKRAGVGLLLSTKATLQMVGKVTEVHNGRIVKATFLGQQGQWTLIAVYAPQSHDREASKTFWEKLDKEIQTTRSQQQRIALVGDFNATPTPEGRDGRPTKGDGALQRLMTKHNLQDMGPQQRTFQHRRNEDGHILSSSRIDLVLGTPETWALIKEDTAKAMDVPWTTSHKAVQIQIDSAAKFPLTDRKLKFKNPLPKAQTEAAQQYADELEDRSKSWSQLESDRHMTKEHAALEMWADMWLHTAHISGVQVRTGTGGTSGRQTTEGDEGHVHAWGFRYGDRKRFWDTVRKNEQESKGRAGMVIRDAENTVQHEPGKVKDILQGYFQRRFTHPSLTTWEEQWPETREEIISTLRTGETVRDSTFEKLGYEEFEQYCTQKLSRGKSGGKEGFSYDMIMLASPQTRRIMFDIYYGPYSRGEVGRIPGTEDSVATMLPKPGDYTLPEKIRLIGLQSAPHQIADGLHIETGRREITRIADHVLHGFLRNRTICEAQWEVRARTEQAIVAGTPWLWLATDVAKAYDEVMREAIAAVMEGLGCPRWWIQHWEKSWEGIRAKILTPHGQTGWVVWRRGVVQGSRSAPLQYVMITIYLARAVRKDAPEVYEVWVADDGFFGIHPQAAPTFLAALRKRYEGIGLRLSKEKLEVFGVNCGNMPEWTIKTTGGPPCQSVELPNKGTLHRAAKI
eukprot:gene17112-biopygen12850